VVASAENGEDALEKAEQYLPDVVMSDIHMPFMDGLTFCRRLKEQQPGTKIVIFSGYDEFEYAKEAIKLEAEEYILKPVDSEELKKVFIRIKESLDEERDKRRNIERLEKYYQESIPILKEQLLIGILEGRVSEEDMIGYQQDYRLSMDAAFYAVGIVKPDYSEEPDLKKDGLRGNLISVSLKQLADEELEKMIDFKSINYLGIIVVVAMLKNTASHKNFMTIMDQICKLSYKMLGINTIAGIGKIYGKLQDISYSFSEAKDAASYRILFDTNQAIYIQDVDPKSDDNYFMDEKQIQQIIKEIKIGSKENLKEAVEFLIRRMKNTAITPAQLQLFFTEIFVEIMRLARGYQLTSQQMNLPDMDIYNEIKNFNSLDDLGSWLLNICMRLRSSIRRERTDTAKLLTEKAKQYIADNYMDSALSVDKVCGHLNVSATYFSALFKKDTGISFVAYLTQLRMEQARRLLDTTEEKSYIIAGMVGYEEPNYFSYVFKKQFGVSPSKYRQKQEKTG
ncbi:MAG TPA: response regulator, partial [Lachnospiraceae bacterium]|nr:response regulator [Lachnospiraceae bacterium]